MIAFVTGSTGLIGGSLVRRLVGKGWSVRALARDRGKAARAFAGLPVEVVEGDVLRPDEFAARFTGCDVLFHAAAYYREYYKRGDHRESLDAINVRATRALLQQADRLGVGRTVHVSSAGVVGKRPGGVAGDEAGPVSPGTRGNLYYRSKLDAEREVEHFTRSHRMPVVVVLPAFTVGPEDRSPTPGGDLVLAFLQRRLPIVLPGGFTMVDARDVAATLEAAARIGRPGERYIAAASHVSFAELLRMLERVSGIPAPTRRVPKALALLMATVEELRARVRGRDPGITRERLRGIFADHRWDSTKARTELGVSFRPLEDTLRDTVSWFTGSDAARSAA